MRTSHILTIPRLRGRFDSHIRRNANMIKILFVCHGNICRSTMAQSVFQYLTAQAGLSEQFHIDSAATSREEIGNPPHYGTQQKLRHLTVPVRCAGRSMTSSTTSSGWTPGIYGISTGSLETAIRTGKFQNCWILRTGKGRTLRTRGIRGILMKLTET